MHRKKNRKSTFSLINTHKSSLQSSCGKPQTFIHTRTCNLLATEGNSIKGLVLGMRMVMANEPAATHKQKQRFPPIFGDWYVNSLGTEDFADVFGGPPRTILFHQPARSTFTSLFYEQIFWHHEVGPVAEMVGRRLPQFKIPVRSSSENEQRKSRFDGFYDDTLEWEDQEKAVQSRSSSTLVLSSEEPILPSTAASSDGGEDDVSTFSAKLRPTNQRKTTSSMAKQVNQSQQNRPPFSSTDSEDDCFENLRNYPFGSSRTNATPETISLDPISNYSFGESKVDFELNSLSSKYYSSSHSDQRQKASNREEDEANSYIVIETSSDDRREKCEPNDIDEAIAWAKQKFQTHCSETSKWSIQGSDQEKPTEGLFDFS